jgi:hypothetical protein
VRTYARKVRSDERWSRATEPVFRKVSEMLNGTFGVPAPAPAPAPAAAGAELSSTFGWVEKEEEGAGARADALPVTARSGLGSESAWPASALVAREWECVSLTSSSSSSSSSEFGRVTRMGDGWGARRPEVAVVSDEGCIPGPSG